MTRWYNGRARRESRFFFFGGRDPLALRAETRPYLPLPRWAGGRCPWREKPLSRGSLRVSAYHILWRRKLKENPSEPKYIHTELGIGYRMLEE